MHPCTQYSTNKRGFTLSELLISLAVLGLISALTLPTIFNNMQQGQRKAKQKEAIQTIQELVYTGYMNGDFQTISNWTFDSSNDPLVQYITTKLNAHHCPKGITTAPCTHNWMNEGLSEANNNHSARWVLPNGVGIWFHDFGVSSTTIGFLIDSDVNNTIATQSVANAEQIALRCNISSSNQTYAINAGPAKPGQCTAWSEGNQTAIAALYQ